MKKSTTGDDNINDVGGVRFTACTFDEAIASVLDSAGSRTGLPVRLSNAWCVVMADSDPTYSKVLNSPGYTFPDGSPIAWIIRRRAGNARAERVRGPSLFQAVLSRSNGRGLRHFFLGSTEGVLTSLIRSVEMRYPDLTIAGAWSPPFGPISEEFLEQASSQLLSTESDIVWVGMGSPKQDFVANQLSRRTGITSVAVGAAFDFLAGTTREAPLWMQRTGTEWLFRLATEPRRLWRRYLVGNVQFLMIVFRHARSRRRHTK